MAALIAVGALCVVGVGVACSTSSAPPAADGCTPAAGACDATKTMPLQLQPFDTQRGCLQALASVPEICGTSVNTCTPSDGLGLVCAFAPDGGVFATVTTDNIIPSAPGWRFALAVGAYPYVFPADQIATFAEQATCLSAYCAPGCDGGASLPYSTCDAAAPTDADSDAATDADSDSDSDSDSATDAGAD